MSFFVLGLNHKECPVEIREKLHFGSAAGSRHASPLREALELSKQFPSISELVILSTCNRVEFYGYDDVGARHALPAGRQALPLQQNSILDLIEKIHSVRRDEFEKYLYRHEGKAATTHLFRVASGLDSLVVGENEILGQLREAFRTANEAQTVHSLLYRLMEKALKVGKDVRTQTKINEGAVSIPSVAVELAEKIFGKLSGEKVMVLGTGEMSALTLKNLKASGADALYVVSRSQERGEKLAAEFSAEWIPLDRWENYLTSVDILIASTSSPHPIVKYDQIKRVMTARRHRPLFLIDIAVPRDIESHINSIDDIYLYNIDDLKGVTAANLKRRSREVQAAEILVEKAVLDYQSWLEQLKARPTLESFENFLNEVLEKELARFAGDGDVSESRRKEVRERIRAKLLHPPLAKIKEASQNGGVTRYLEALHSLFDLDKK